MPHISTTFTGTGSGNSFKVRRVLAAIGGNAEAAFVGEVKIKWIDDVGTERYATDESGVEITLTTNNQMYALNFGVPVIVSLECTSYTSGSILASLTGELMYST